jgi:hypothetical protein
MKDGELLPVTCAGEARCRKHDREVLIDRWFFERQKAPPRGVDDVGGCEEKD